MRGIRFQQVDPITCVGRCLDGYADYVNYVTTTNGQMAAEVMYIVESFECKVKLHSKWNGTVKIKPLYSVLNAINVSILAFRLRPFLSQYVLKSVASSLNFVARLRSSCLAS